MSEPTPEAKKVLDAALTLLEDTFKGAAIVIIVGQEFKDGKKLLQGVGNSTNPNVEMSLVSAFLESMQKSN